MKRNDFRPSSYSEYLEASKEIILNYTCCVSCTEPFHPTNTHTSDGWKETQISGMCENCFDSLFTEEGE